MLINYQKFIIFLLVISALFSFIFLPQTVVATDDYGLEDTLKIGNVGEALGQGDDDPGNTMARRIGSIIGIVLSFIGVLFLCLMLYGGIIWMMARGNEQEVEKAKNIIISAVFGLVIVLAAYAITAFIGEKLLIGVE